MEKKNDELVTSNDELTTQGQIDKEKETLSEALKEYEEIQNNKPEFLNTKNGEITVEDVFTKVLEDMKNETTDQEELDILDNLKKNDFDFDKTKKETVENVRKESFNKFMKSNINLIKSFISSDISENTTRYNEDFDFCIDGVDYRFKEEFFELKESFSTSNKDIDNKLYIIDTVLLKNKLEDLDESNFEAYINEYNEKMKDNEKKVNYNKEFIIKEIIEIINFFTWDVVKKFEILKLRHGDIHCIDLLINEKTIKEYLSESNNIDTTSLISSAKFTTESFIKRIVKDYKKLNTKLNKDDKLALLSMATDIGELFGILLLVKTKELKENEEYGVNEVVAFINENASSPEVTRVIATGRYIIAKALRDLFAVQDNKRFIAILSSSFYNIPIEKSYIFERSLQIINDLTLEDLEKKELIN